MSHKEAKKGVRIGDISAYNRVQCVISMMHFSTGRIVIDSVAGVATPLSADAWIRRLITFPVQIVVASIPRRAPATAAIGITRGNTQIIVVFSRENIMPLSIIGAAILTDPPEIAAG
jgi:hypothetical protein